MPPKRKRCSGSARCTRRVSYRGLCNTHLLQLADAAFSRYIRKRDVSCVVCGSTAGLQCMHIVSRRYRQVRWNRSNAVAGCLKCHMYYTHRPLEWQQYIDDSLGPGVWDTLRAEALNGQRDWKELAAEWIEK